MTRQDIEREFTIREGKIVSALVGAILLIAGAVHADPGSRRTTFEAREVELISFESHSDHLLDFNRPLYRLGEILKTGSGEWVVPVNRHFNGQEWVYSVTIVKVGKQ